VHAGTVEAASNLADFGSGTDSVKVLCKVDTFVVSGQNDFSEKRTEMAAVAERSGDPTVQTMAVMQAKLSQPSFASAAPRHTVHPRR
jgi:hypothetical protein